MGCNYCEKYNGPNNFCSEEEFVETGLELINCDEYSYNGKLKYYSYLSKKDEMEVQEIIKGVVSYIMRMGFDDLTATHDQIESCSSLLIESIEWIGKASETIDEELEGVLNEAE